MEKSITNISGSSSGTSTYRGRGRVCGIPKKCWCGAGIDERISQSKANPSRWYYRCPFAATNLLKDDPHVFKWMDEAMQEEDKLQCSQVGGSFKDNSEVELLNYRVGVLEVDVRELKMKMDITDSLEAEFADTKRSMKKLMVIVFCGCFVMVVLGLLAKDIVV